MKTLSFIIAVLLIAETTSVSYAFAEAPGFERYEVILSRMPFGAEPALLPGGAAGQPVPPEESFAKNLKMCAVTRNFINGKPQVGLVDAASKKNYFLAVGEEQDGILVVEADYEGERARLRKGAEDVWIQMSDAKTMVTIAQAPPTGARGAAWVPGGARSSPNARRGVVVRESKIEAPLLTGEALTKHLESYQMDLIRAGGEKGPPLPMELTPAMDAQLVKEGVLPPVE